MSPSQCPPDDVLGRYASGELSEAEARAVDTHIGRCTDCLARLDGLATPTDSLLGALRQPQQPVPDEHPALAKAVSAVLAAPVPPSGLPPGAVLSGYRILEVLGRGGMGQVYRAAHPRLDQEVALKVLLPGMDSAPILARFEAERQALARMDHPHIARVFDGGVTEDGRPFFVMELVRGVAVTRYCDDHRLDLRRRLELFVAVCRAVQHAHQKGIIHRDLKPSNVLVAEYDGRPTVKVIDFGLAKPLDRRSAGQTEVGMLLGTPEYMSPEQANLAANDADTRTDVYALGVLLYELLTRDTPFERRRLRAAPVPEVLRVIREEEPPAPSARLTAAGSAELARRVRGDLDWIVLKALAKERDRRYETADGLAQDVVRYLADEPVQAGPPSAGYRVRKFVRRHKGPVSAAALVVLTLAGGVLASAWEAVQAHQERDRAVGAEGRERQAAQDARDAERQTKGINDFLLNGILAAARPKGHGLGRDVTLKQALDEALPKLDKAFPNDPLTEAKIRQTLAESYYRLGVFAEARDQYQKALALLRRAYGPEHEEVFACQGDLGVVLRALGELPAAADLYRQSLAGLTRTAGPDSPHTLTAQSNLGLVLKLLGQKGEAERLYRQSWEGRHRILGPDHADTLQVQHNLAALLAETGRFAQAAELFRQTLAARRRVLGAEHPQTLSTQNGLARLLFLQKKYAEAEDLERQTYDIRTRVLGPDHPDTLVSLNNLAEVILAAGRPGDAEPLLREVLARRRKTLPAQHPYNAGTSELLGCALMALNRPADAEPVLREALAIAQSAFPPGHAAITSAQNSLGDCLLRERKYAEAEPLLLAAAQRPGGARGVRPEPNTQALQRLVDLYSAWGKSDQAAQWREKLEAARMAKSDLEDQRLDVSREAAQRK